MRKILTLVAATGVLAGSTVAAHALTTNNWNQGEGSDDNAKVLLCHLTDSETPKFVVQSVSKYDVKSHELKGDFVYLGTTNDDGKATDPTWCANHQTGDVCPNIDGKQATIPDGLVLTDGQCVQPPVVVTPPVTTTTAPTTAAAQPVPVSAAVNAAFAGK